MDNDFFIKNEDSILRSCHPLYNAFCQEDEASYEPDPYAEAEAKWELQDER